MLYALDPVPAVVAPQVYFEDIRVDTGETLQFVDVTDSVAGIVSRSGITSGLATVQSMHTTCAVIVNEHEPLLLEDLKRVLERAAPRTEAWRHDDFSLRTVNLAPDEQPNGHAHAKAVFLQASETIRVRDGRLHLGRWQRLFFVELDRARPREIAVTVLGVPTRV